MGITQMGLGALADGLGVPFARYRELWDHCQVCQETYNSLSVVLECHHIIGGTKGRSDELTNLICLCRSCHQRLGPHSEENLGTILFWKWATDRGTLSWVRLAILHRRFLPDLQMNLGAYQRYLERRRNVGASTEA